MLKTYTQWAVQRFVDWQRLPESSEEWTIRSKRIRRSYMSLAEIILYLFQASPEMSHEEWMRENEELAFCLNDILSLLKDSADWAVCATEEIEGIFAIAPHEISILEQSIATEFGCKYGALAKAFNRTMIVIRASCNHNIRLRNAIVRLNWAFTMAEELLAKKKGGDPIAYLQALDRMDRIIPSIDSLF